MNFAKTQALIRFLVIYCILITIYIFDKTQFNSIKLDKCLPNKHSVCFINKRFCHPGYTGEKCDVKLIPANPWYTAHCPNLDKEITYEINTPLSDLSNNQDCKIGNCGYLCNFIKFF